MKLRESTSKGIHTGISPICAKTTQRAFSTMRSLAMSNTAPKSEVVPRRLAIQPSSPSLIKMKSSTKIQAVMTCTLPS